MGRHELVLESELAAAPKDVWKVVSDPRTYPKWMPGIEKVDLGEHKAMKKGATFRVVTAMGASKLVSDCEVTAFAAEQAFAWTHRKDVLDGEPFEMMREARSEFDLAKAGKGTRLVARISFEPHGMKAKLGANYFLHKSVKPQMEQALEKLGRLVA